MINNLLKKTVIGFSLITLIAANNVHAHKKTSRKKYSRNNNNASRVVLHVGKSRHTMSVIPDLIAEFKNMSQPEKSALSKTYTNTRTIYNFPSVRIWKTGDAAIKEELTKGRLPLNLNADHSPVFKDRSGRMRALPGNIIIRMAKSWDKNKVEAWAKEKDIKIIRRLSSSRNTYLMETPPGAECLNISNKLNKEPGVVSSQPDWWIKTYPR